MRHPSDKYDRNYHTIEKLFKKTSAEIVLCRDMDILAKVGGDCGVYKVGVGNILWYCYVDLIWQGHHNWHTGGYLV